MTNDHFHIPQEDFILPFQIEGTTFRTRLIRLGNSLETILKAHQYPPVTQKSLSEIVALACAFASLLKFEGKFSLQIQGNGPIAFAAADITSKGALRAYARHQKNIPPEDIQQLSKKKTLSTTDIFGEGHMIFTVEHENMPTPWQGIAALTKTTLAQCAQEWFMASDQLPTKIFLFSPPYDNETLSMKAAAMILQKIPLKALSSEEQSQEKENWQRITLLAKTLTAEEALNPLLSPDQLLLRLFHEEGCRLFAPRTLFHQCTCSRDKMNATLLALPPQELKNMTDNNIITMTCEFCNHTEIFPYDEITH